MWATEHSLETTASPEAIWRVWSDVPGWPEWNADIQRIEITGPFAEGSTISMQPAGQDPVALRIVDAVEPYMFIDEADLGEIVVRTIHHVDSRDDGSARVTYRMEISGPAADSMGPAIGPEISGDFPEVLAELVKRAES